MANPKCNLPEEEREKVMNGVGLWMTDKEEQTARTLFPQYLFYDNIGDRQVFCTACRERFDVNPKKRGKHNTNGVCPYCGHNATWAVVGKYSYQMSTLTSRIKTAIAYPAGDGGLYIIAGEAERSFNWGNLCGEIDWHPWKIYYFRRGAAMMCSLRKVYNRWDFSQLRKVYNCWDFPQREEFVLYEEKIKEPFAPNFQGYANYAGDYNIIGLEEALEKSDFKYCQILPFYEYEYAARLGELETARYMVKYLAWYALHPQIEMAVKLGLSDAVEQFITDGKENKRLLDWNAATPADFLRMDKQSAKQFMRAGLDFTDLKLWRAYGKGLGLDQYIDIATAIGRNDMPTLSACAKAAGADISKAARYIRNLVGGSASKITRACGLWKDYLNMAAKLGYDLTDVTVAMPKNLEERHDAAAETIKYQENKEENRKYKARYKKLNTRFAFELGGLRVVVPKSEQEIINEGKTLHHCVGGYAARHMNGKTTILFLRKARTPGRPFLTIELAEKRETVYIVQIHGYKNERYPAAVRPEDKYSWFLKPWLDWVNSGSRRDKDGKPLIENKEATA